MAAKRKPVAKKPAKKKAAAKKGPTMRKATSADLRRSAASAQPADVDIEKDDDAFGDDEDGLEHEDEDGGDLEGEDE